VAADGGASIDGCGQSAGGRVILTTSRLTVRPANAASGLVAAVSLSATLAGSLGRVGVIGSGTRPFCGTYDRSG
jgi:hypothetical protein